MRIVQSIKAAIGAATLAALSIAPASAQSVEEFYANHDVTLVLSATAGSATDFFGRQFAPYLSKHIPGQPNVIVSNLAGASGMKAALQLSANDPKDGTVMALLQRNNFYLPLVDPTIGFDPKSVQWLGSLNKEYYTVMVWQNVPVDSADELFTKSISLGATSFANENRTFAALMNDYYGTKFQIVPGYAGNAELGLALERGEIQSRLQTTNTLKSGTEAEWYKSGKVKVLAQLGVTKAPGFEDVPNIFERATDPEVISLSKFMLRPLAAGRPFAIPGGVPEDRAAALQKAFLDAAADPEFIAHMESLGSDLEVIDGAELESIIDEIYATSPAVLDKVRGLLIPK